MKCKKCGKNVKDKTIIKHLWADHRALMMKNHKSGFQAGKKKGAAKVGKKTAAPRTVTHGPLKHQPSVNGAWQQETRLRSTYVATGKPLEVTIHQGTGVLTILNVSKIEVLE